MLLTEENSHLFWDGICCQWLDKDIIVDGTKYMCCEQYMMAQKALVFGDMRIHDLVMYSNDPRSQKALGRKIEGYSDEIWHQTAQLVVYRGNLAKFTQHPDLKQWLMETGTKLIVEASPTDRIWGIGWSENDKEAWDTDKWRGKNWLGECIMKVRSDIRQMAHYA